MLTAVNRKKILIAIYIAGYFQNEARNLLISEQYNYDIWALFASYFTVLSRSDWVERDFSHHCISNFNTKYLKKDWRFYFYPDRNK